jgi:hypothetical protein
MFVIIMDVTGALLPLVELLRGGLEEGRAMAAGAMINLAAGDPTAVVAAGAIPPLVELLHSGLKLGRVYAAQVLSVP